jgi:hypothetical protein
MLTGAKDEERRPESEVGEKSWRPTQAPMDGGAPMILRPRGGAEDVQLARKNSWWCSFARKVGGGGVDDYSYDSWPPPASLREMEDFAGPIRSPVHVPAGCWLLVA